MVERSFPGNGARLDVQGVARCETAGNDVLSAKTTSPCDVVKTLPDVVVCVYEPATSTARVFVGSRY